MTRTIESWLLHKQWSGDTSARVTLFTRELGVIKALYKGGRTPKKQALLQAFTPLWSTIEERYERCYINSIEGASASLFLTGDALFSALYINEVLYHALSPQSSDPQLFAAYVFTLKSLALTPDKAAREALLRRFEWCVLKSCGYSFSLTSEAHTGHFIVENLYYQFIAGEGFVPHYKGILGSHILALANDNLESADFLKSAKFIMRQAIDHLLDGRELKVRSLYKSRSVVSIQDKN